jgi:hypothetical protein
MAYDSALGNMVLFGGIAYSGDLLNDTWTWDGTTWTQQSPATSPSGGSGASMAYDAGTGQLVLFGGYDPPGLGGPGFLNDTWTWDGTTWTQLHPATSPPARAFASMAYDAGTGQLVLFGGGITGTGLEDTWTWDGTTWTQQSPASSPPALGAASMAYDSSTEQLVLFGGDPSSGPPNDTTWTWTGSTWIQLNPATSPSGRTGASMAYVAGTGQLVLFGGATTGELGDTWTWDGTTWTQQSPATSPPARTQASMDYDSDTGQLVLFGGVNTSPFIADDDTWLYASTPPAVTPEAPFVVLFPAAALVVFGVVYVYRRRASVRQGTNARAIGP